MMRVSRHSRCARQPPIRRNRSRKRRRSRASRSTRSTLPNRAKLEADLAQAEKDLAAKPNDADAIIWVGRRLGYLWRYQDAIAMFSKGIALHPNNPEAVPPPRPPLHHDPSVRSRDRRLREGGGADQGHNGRDRTRRRAESDRASRGARCTSTSGITSALAHYLKGDYQKALDAYNECMKVSTNDDSITATSDWLWMTLMRLNRKAEAAKVLERITPKMDILENGSYHRRLLMYKGLEKPEALLDPANADGLTIATQGYGVGNWYFVTGNIATRARDLREGRRRPELVGVRLHRGRGRSAADEVSGDADDSRHIGHGDRGRCATSSCALILCIIQRSWCIRRALGRFALAVWPWRCRRRAVAVDP